MSNIESKYPSSEVTPTTPPMLTSTAAPEPSSIRSAMSIGNLIGPVDDLMGDHLLAVPSTPPTVAAGTTNELTLMDTTLPPIPSTVDSANRAHELATPQTEDDFSSAIVNSPGGADNMSVHTDDIKTDEGEAADASAVFVPLKDREFICVNDDFSDCQTGQVTMDLSRKVISDHFGRNKACTRLIKDWPLFCRKHYQRATYKPALWQLRKIDLIARQLDKIELQFPGTVYDVTFKKSEENRLNEFARKVASGMSVDHAAALVAPAQNVKSFQAPVQVLRQLELYTGKHKSLADVKDAVATILDMLQNEETAQVPSIEFLPVFPSATAQTSPAKTSRAKLSPSKASLAQASIAGPSTPGAAATQSSFSADDQLAINDALQESKKGSPKKSRVSSPKGAIQKLKK